jgi:hypothetical protein
MKFPQCTYRDLTFLIPSEWSPDLCLPWKFMVFFNSRWEAEEAALYLQSLVPLEIRRHLPWFLAGMTSFFQVEEMVKLREGETYGACLTDAGGMVSTASGLPKKPGLPV